MTLQAIETLLSSAAKFNKLALCLMIRLLVCNIRVTFCLLIKDQIPLSKRVTLNFSSRCVRLSRN